jgi:hypothetical protein
MRAEACGVRAIARRLGRSPSTISGELGRNASTRSGGFRYRATTAQWRADRRARRPKPARLAVNAELRAYVQDRLAGVVKRPNGISVDRVGQDGHPGVDRRAVGARGLRRGRDRLQGRPSAARRARARRPQGPPFVPRVDAGGAGGLQPVRARHRHRARRQGPGRRDLHRAPLSPPTSTSTASPASNAAAWPARGTGSRSSPNATEAQLRFAVADVTMQGHGALRGRVVRAGPLRPAQPGRPPRAAGGRRA